MLKKIISFSAILLGVFGIFAIIQSDNQNDTKLLDDYSKELGSNEINTGDPDEGIILFNYTENLENN